jgi:hypothetical protein
MENCPGDDLFVELPQVFDAPAAPSDDDEIDGRKRRARRGEFANGDGDLLSCAASLHAHRVD